MLALQAAFTSLCLCFRKSFLKPGVTAETGWSATCFCLEHFNQKAHLPLTERKLVSVLFDRAPGSFKALAITWVCLLVLLQRITAEEG